MGVLGGAAADATDGPLDAKTAGKLIATGLAFGCIHVLSGADHLSALATLSVGSRFKAFSLGIRWGLGHSTGLVVVAAVLLSLDEKVDPTALEHTCNWIVGVFMIALGLWGVFKAVKNERLRKEQEGEDAAIALRATPGPTTALVEGDGGEKDGGEEEAAAAAAAAGVGVGNGRVGNGASASGGSSDTSASSLRDGDGIELSPLNGQEEEEEEEEDVEAGRAGRGDGEPIGGAGKTETAAPMAGGAQQPQQQSQQDSLGARSVASVGTQGSQAAAEEPLIFLDRRCENAEHWVLRRCRCFGAINIESPIVQRIVAFSVGIVHGIAGPGGILGVLPAVQLHSWPKATLYLFTFCFASTLIMGIFAALYGEVTSRVGSAKKCEFRLELFSASLSIIVGVLWLALIIAGKLNVVFG